MAFVLRVVGLASSPTGFTPDEASFGYDAYSLLKTGKDQWGASWPLSFRSFGDFKLPLYTYLTMPTVAVLGLNEFAVRLPNALLGTLAVLVTFYLVAEVFKDKRVAFVSAFLFAVSPWHVPLSRGAFEANLTTFLLPIGLLFFYKGLAKPKFFVFSAIFLGLNLFSYHTARLLTPALILFLVLQAGNKKFELVKSNYFKISAVLFAIFVLVAGITMFGAGGTRAATSGIFNPTGGWSGLADKQYKSVLSGEHPALARIFNNKLTYLGSTVFENYLTYFSPQFLFTQGPAEGTYGMVPGTGVLYLFEAAFLFAFVGAVVTGKIKNAGWLIVWILLSPVAASIAKGPGLAANRVAFMMPAVQIMSAIGCVVFFDMVIKLAKHKQKAKILFLSVFSMVFIISFLFFLEKYIFGQRVHQAKAMIYGVSEVVAKVNSLESSASEIIISKKVSEPHIYFAFYNKIDPTVTQSQSTDWIKYVEENKDWVDQLDKYFLDKYTFKSIDTIADFRRDNAIIVGLPSEFGELIPDDVIAYPDKSPAYYIFQTGPQFALK